jgi:hypothetical protein
MPIGAIGAQSNVFFNAKDVRSLDCVNALFERYSALHPENNVSNFWEIAIGAGENYRTWFYRAEAANLQSLKDIIQLYMLGNFYTVTNTATNVIVTALTESNLCALASVPTNFLRYTPARAADGSWAHYGRFYTNTYFLLSTGIYELVTSAGTEIPYTNSTPSNSVTLYSTNTSIQAGRSLTEYGWDGLRRVITNLHTTVANSQWWTGTEYINREGTNYTVSVPASISNLVTPVVSVGDDGGIDVSRAKADIIAANSWSDPIETPDNWTWDWTYTNAAGAAVTNKAPYFTNTASYSFIHSWDVEYTAYIEYGLMTDSNWYGEVDSTYRHTASATGRWDHCAAPVRSWNSNAIAPRTVQAYLATNGASWLHQETNLPANSIEFITTNFAFALPAFPDFGFTNGVTAEYSGDGGGVDYHYVYWGMSGYILDAFYNRQPITGSTNLSNRSAAIYKVLDKWDFEYK